MPTFPGAALLAVLLLLSVQAPAQAQAQAQPEAVRGKLIWQQRCAECHAVDTDETGPRHRGVFGRRAGSIKGYDYSRALRRSGVLWNAAALDRWLADPEKFIPGQNMDFKVRDRSERLALIAYLESIAGPVTPARGARSTPTPTPIPTPTPTPTSTPNPAAQNSRATPETPRR